MTTAKTSLWPLPCVKSRTERTMEFLNRVYSCAPYEQVRDRGWKDLVQGSVPSM